MSDYQERVERGLQDRPGFDPRWDWNPEDDLIVKEEIGGNVPVTLAELIRKGATR